MVYNVIDYVLCLCSGLIADRVNLRYFLTFGMFGKSSNDHPLFV